MSALSNVTKKGWPNWTLSTLISMEGIRSKFLFWFLSQKTNSSHLQKPHNCQHSLKMKSNFWRKRQSSFSTTECWEINNLDSCMRFVSDTVFVIQFKSDWLCWRLTGQTIPIVMRISLSIKKISCKISQILKHMHEADGFSAKTLGESLFQFQNDWSGHGLAGQFCLLESVLWLHPPQYRFKTSTSTCSNQLKWIREILNRWFCSCISLCVKLENTNCESNRHVQWWEIRYHKVVSTVFNRCQVSLIDRPSRKPSEFKPLP